MPIIVGYGAAMDLDLFDAIRLHRLIEIDVAAERYIVEPYEVSTSDEGSSLLAFVVEGPRLGWNQFQQWSNLKITRKNFTPREPSTS